MHTLSTKRPEYISKETLKQLNQLHPMTSWFELLLDVASIVGAAAAAEHVGGAAVYLAAITWIGSRFGAIAILAHDAAHNRLFKQRWLNNAIGELIMWVLFINLKSYRAQHLTHHRELNTEHDPDWVHLNSLPEYQFPQKPATFLFHCAYYLSGLKLFYIARRMLTMSRFSSELSKLNKTLQYATYASLWLSALYLDFWRVLLLYWLVPLFTTFMLVYYIRNASEHHGLDYSHPLRQSRAVMASWWERALFLPHNTHLHLDHHLYPSVPFSRLPELHTRLMDNEAYRSHAHITDRIFPGLLREWLRAPEQAGAKDHV